MMHEGERARKKKKGKVFVLIDCEDGYFCLLILLHLRKKSCASHVLFTFHLI